MIRSDLDLVVVLPSTSSSVDINNNNSNNVVADAAGTQFNALFFFIFPLINDDLKMR